MPASNSEGRKRAEEKALQKSKAKHPSQPRPDFGARLPLHEAGHCLGIYDQDADVSFVPFDDEETEA